MNSNNVRRRVPDQLRKRSALSYDFCKIRRRKCVRSGLQNSCKLCLKHGVDCVSTIPRKLNNSRSSTHATQCHALRDLVVRLFPELDIDNPEEISRLFQRVDNGNIEVIRHDSAPPSVSALTGNVSKRDRGSVADSGVSSPTTNTDESSIVPTPTLSFYERLLKRPSGTVTYFGPSSSMAYVRKMRELLAVVTDSTVLWDSNRDLRRNFIMDQDARTMGEDQDAPASTDRQRPIIGVPQVNSARLGISDASGPAVARLERLKTILPLGEELDQLIESYFTHVHNNHTLFHRPSFQAITDQVRSPGTRMIDVGWAVCLRLVVAFGCEWHMSSLEPNDSPNWKRLASLKRDLVKDSLADICDLILSGNLQSVVAFSLLSTYMTFANERNASIILSGCAIRMAMGLGLHRGDDGVRHSDIYLTPLERELRKQIWCSIYIIEEYSSGLFGRPSAVDGIDIVVDLPNEAILDQGLYWPPGFLDYDVSLARLAGRIRDAQSNQSLSLTDDLEGLPNLALCYTLLNELDDWEKRLPAFLVFDETKVHSVYPTHLRQIIMLHMRYQYLRALLSRPFLLKALCNTHSSSEEITIDPAILEFKGICIKSAMDSWTLIHCPWTKGKYNATVWLDGVFAYQCILILSLYLFDTSKATDHIDVPNLRHIVAHLQHILQKVPRNKTMGRLIQISCDFSEIISTTSTSIASPNGTHTSRTPAELGPIQSPHAEALNPTASDVSDFADFQLPDMPILSWDNDAGTEFNMFYGDFLGEDGIFSSFSDFHTQDRAPDV